MINETFETRDGLLRHGSTMMVRRSTVFLDRLTVGVGIYDIPSQTFSVTNRQLNEWFADIANATDARPLQEWFNHFDQAALDQCLEADKPYTFTTFTKKRRREIYFSVAITADPDNDSQSLVIEVTNISKTKELEYLIESYTEMTELRTRNLMKDKERVEKKLRQLLTSAMEDDHEMSMLEIDFEP